MFYSLFVFRLSYKIIGLSSLTLAGRGLAGCGLTRLWPAGMGWVWAWAKLAFTVWVGPGPGLGRAWA